jgi:hypothetical protein
VFMKREPVDDPHLRLLGDLGWSRRWYQAFAFICQARGWILSGLDFTIVLSAPEFSHTYHAASTGLSLGVNGLLYVTECRVQRRASA